MDEDWHLQLERIFFNWMWRLCSNFIDVYFFTGLRKVNCKPTKCKSLLYNSFSLGEEMLDADAKKCGHK